MSTTFKSSLVPHLLKTFVMLMVVMFAVRYGEIFLFGDAVMATYKVVLALPVVVTLLVFLSERTSIREIVIEEDGIRVTAYSGDTVKVTWKSVTEAVHSRPKRFFSRPLWEFRNKAGEKLHIPNGLFPRAKERNLSTMITDRLPDDKVVIVN
ncbi:MAG: hypothetical protein ACE5D4_01060 [Thermodesulfobacteriota bacterium]